MRELNSLGGGLGLYLAPLEGREIPFSEVTLDLGQPLSLLLVEDFTSGNDLSPHVGPDVGGETSDGDEVVELEHEVVRGVPLAQLYMQSSRIDTTKK